jgi:CheY-like chemotaxis protein
MSEEYNKVSFERDRDYQVLDPHVRNPHTIFSCPQVLFNLLGNAVKFSKEKGVIELVVTYENGHYDYDSFASTELSEIEQQQLQQGGPVSFDVRSQQTMSPSRCPFNRPTRPSREGKTAKLNIDVELSAVVKGPAANSPCKHSGLLHRQRQNLRFVVTDYGKGIDSSDFEAIFRPFQQASGTEMNVVYGGTGLGLAITKKLVSVLGGTISVDSMKGSWSKFTVELPCSDPPAPVKELTTKMSDATVLIVGLPDDQQGNVSRLFSAFSIDIRLVKSVDDLSLILCSRGSGSLAVDRRILCLIRGDRLTAPWLRLASENRMQRNLNMTVFSYGPYVSKETNASMLHIHHIRSLEQVIPQTLIEMLHVQSSTAPSFTHGKISKWRSETLTTDSAFQHLRVLVAEDNNVNQKVLLRMLGRLGVYCVDVVGNGRDAVEKEESTTYDVILMDQQMPVMGGIQACRLILDRQERRWPVPYIFFVTAHVSVTFEKECREAGCSGFLPKPFKIADIETCIRNVAKMVNDRDALCVHGATS